MINHGIQNINALVCINYQFLIICRNFLLAVLDLLCPIRIVQSINVNQNASTFARLVLDNDGKSTKTLTVRMTKETCKTLELF